MCDSVRRSSHSGSGFADVAECFQVFAFPPEKCEVRGLWPRAQKHVHCARLLSPQESADQQH